MLNDIGLKGFNRLAPDQQESVLLDAIKHASITRTSSNVWRRANGC
jgi:hypothetical protein